MKSSKNPENRLFQEQNNPMLTILQHIANDKTTLAFTKINAQPALLDNKVSVRVSQLPSGESQVEYIKPQQHSEDQEDYIGITLLHFVGIHAQLDLFMEIINRFGNIDLSIKDKGGAGSTALEWLVSGIVGDCRDYKIEANQENLETAGALQWDLKDLHNNHKINDAIHTKLLNELIPAIALLKDRLNAVNDPKCSL